VMICGSERESPRSRWLRQWLASFDADWLEGVEGGGPS
jgi:hypothetical protein